MTIPHQVSVFRFHSIDDVDRQLHVLKKDVPPLDCGRRGSALTGSGGDPHSQRDLEGFLSASRK